MRHAERYIEKCSLRGKNSQIVQDNNRLQAAIEFGPIRPIESIFLYEINTRNPRTGQEHHFELHHDVGNGSGKFNVYLDGEKWRTGWSKTKFTKWLFSKIDSVVNFD